MEVARMREAREQGVAWRRWGPYLNERQWGMVREDGIPTATTGPGMGASHRTGWTGLVCVLLSAFGTWTARDVLEGVPAAGRRLAPEGASPAR
jgi:hypothetical protein